MTRTPLLLLPGLGIGGGLWRHQIAALADIAEASVGDTLQDSTLPAMARRILDDAPDRFALAGLSMGGYLAFEIMRQAPERVTRLALLDTSARADSEDQTANRRKAIANVESGGDYRTLAEASLPNLLSDDAEQDVRDAVVEMSVRVGGEVYVRQQKAIMARPDSRGLLTSIDVPTLVLVGEKDKLTPPELAKEMADGIAGATLVIVPDAAHLSPLENPDSVTAALREWLTR
jgi:pimeloyl-ACP methyl ester carboxylesterase